MPGTTYGKAFMLRQKYLSRHKIPWQIPWGWYQPSSSSSAAMIRFAMIVFAMIRFAMIRFAMIRFAMQLPTGPSCAKTSKGSFIVTSTRREPNQWNFAVSESSFWWDFVRILTNASVTIVGWLSWMFEFGFGWIDSNRSTFLPLNDSVSLKWKLE